MNRPSRETLERIAAALGGEPIASKRAAGGYTPAERWVVRCASGTRAFVKLGTTPLTARMLRAEHATYTALEASFMPRLLAWDDHASHPMLVLEDLSDARWPPPWDPALVHAVVETLATLHRSAAKLPAFEDIYGQFEASGWADVAADPAAFLGLGLASGDWLEGALPQLLAREKMARTRGDSVIHFDVRSDNLCLSDRGVVLIDWNLACLGNGDLDLGFWLPSLESEGGPPPETLLPDRPDIAAWVSGFFAARAGLPLIPDAPHVRSVQRKQLVPALSWAARALGLPQPN